MAGYRIVKSQRGKDLIMFNDYTYANIGQSNTWVCSTRHPACKARLKLNKDRYIVEISNSHLHPPKKAFVTYDGTIVRL